LWKGGAPLFTGIASLALATALFPPDWLFDMGIESAGGRTTSYPSPQARAKRGEGETGHGTRCRTAAAIATRRLLTRSAPGRLAQSPAAAEDDAPAVHDVRA